MRGFSQGGNSFAFRTSFSWCLLFVFSPFTLFLLCMQESRACAFNFPHSRSIALFHCSASDSLCCMYHFFLRTLLLPCSAIIRDLLSRLFPSQLVLRPSLCIPLPSFVHPSLSLFGSSSYTPANLFAGQWMRYLPSHVHLKVSVAKQENESWLRE